MNQQRTPPDPGLAIQEERRRKEEEERSKQEEIQREQEQKMATAKSRQNAATSLLKVAATFASQGKDESEERWLKRVISTYPETEAAQEARTLLGIGEVVSSRRVWNDATGTYQVEAEFVDMEDGKVRLRKSSGDIITIPIEKFSDVDQEWVKKQTDSL